MPRPRPKFYYSTARELLCLCEYHYRLGVLHACSSADSELIRSVSMREDDYMTVQYLDKDLIDISRSSRKFDVHIDKLVALCREIFADNLANYLRYEWSDSSLREICTVIDYHYRHGLNHGLRLRDPRKAKEFFSKVGRGNDHRHLFGKQKWNTFEYFDKIKDRINTLHYKRIEYKKVTVLRTLSVKIGDLVSAEREKILREKGRI